MLKIRRSRDRLIFNMGIPIPYLGKTVFILRPTPDGLVLNGLNEFSTKEFNVTDVTHTPKCIDLVGPAWEALLMGDVWGGGGVSETLMSS